MVYSNGKQFPTEKERGQPPSHRGMEGNLETPRATWRFANLCRGLGKKKGPCTKTRKLFPLLRVSGGQSGRKTSFYFLWKSKSWGDPSMEGMEEHTYQRKKKKGTSRGPSGKIKMGGKKKKKSPSLHLWRVNFIVKRRIWTLSHQVGVCGKVRKGLSDPIGRPNKNVLSEYLLGFRERL